MFNLTNLYYPSYAIAIPKAISILYIPTQGSVGLFSQAGEELNILKFTNIKTIQDTVLEGFLTDNKLLFYDALPLVDFKKGKCSLIYEDRLSLLHKVIYSYLCSHNLFTEAYYQKVMSPIEIKRFYIDCLTNNYKGAIVKNSVGLYTWGKVNDEDSTVLELIPKGK